MIEFRIGDLVELSDINCFLPTGWIRQQTFPLRVINVSCDGFGAQLIHFDKGILGYYSRHFKLHNEIQFINN